MLGVVESVGFDEGTVLAAVGEGSLAGMAPVEPIPVLADGKGCLETVSELVESDDSAVCDAELR